MKRLKRKLRRLARLVNKTEPARVATARLKNVLKLWRTERMAHAETKRKLDEALAKENASG